MTSMIVCPEPHAAHVGREVFAKGGNAIDAAIATAFSQCVTNPLRSSLGGTGILYYYSATRKEGTILNFEVTIGSRPIPEHWKHKRIIRQETVGRYVLQGNENYSGYQSIMTPGFVRGCWNAYKRFGSGRISWAELLMPSAHLALHGFELDPYAAASWHVPEESPDSEGILSKLSSSAQARAVYLKPEGTPYEAGEKLVQPELGATIQRLAEAGGEDFYRGEIGRAIAEDLTTNSALLTAKDLERFIVEVDKPLSGQYRDLTVSAPPFSGGVAVIQMLQVLGNFDLEAMGHNTPEYIDTISRIFRACFADFARLKGLHKKVAAPLERELLDPERARALAVSVRSGKRIVVRGGQPKTGTTHLTCVDSDRNVVSLNHSVGSPGGSAVISPGLGFLYNNFLGHFNPLPGQPDSIEPGKKLIGGAALIIFEGGRPYIAIGAPGGSRIITAIVQSIVNVVDHGMEMQKAVAAPRFHSEEEQLILLEPLFSNETAQHLGGMGNTVKRSRYMSLPQAIRILGEVDLEAGSDPRGSAAVAH